MKKTIMLAALMASTFFAHAQAKQDTVIIELAKTSRVIFTMRDKNDLEILKHYDFNELFKDIMKKLDPTDSTTVVQRDTTRQSEPTVAEEDWSTNNNSDDDDDDDNNWHDRHHRRGHTMQSFNFDLGTNNYLSNGKFPDSENAAYAVRPWGSWYVGVASVQRTRLGKKFFMEWGLGMSW